jgi:hypothetical protein
MFNKFKRYWKFFTLVTGLPDRQTDNLSSSNIREGKLRLLPELFVVIINT